MWALLAWDNKAVDIGEIDADADKVREVWNVRNLIFWSAKAGGLSGVATEGPASDCRLSAKADYIKRPECKLLLVIPLTDEARAKIEKFPVWRG